MIYFRGNYQFTKDIVGWVNRQSKYLRVDSLVLNGAQTENGQYFTDEHVEIILELSEKINGKWDSSHLDSISFEIRMMETFTKTDLVKNEHGQFTSTIKLPNRNGVYTIHLTTPIGYNTLPTSQISIREHRYGQVKDFDLKNLPYYLSFAISVIAFFFFNIAWNLAPKMTKNI